MLFFPGYDPMPMNRYPMIDLRIVQSAMWKIVENLRSLGLWGLCLCLVTTHGLAFQLPPPPPALPSPSPGEEGADPFPLDGTGMERSVQNVPFTLTTTTISPFSKVRLGRQFAIRCRVVNEQKQRDTVTVVANIVGQPGEQFARKITMDGGTAKSFDIPLPLSERYQGTFIEVSCTLWVEREGKPTLIQRDGEAIEQKMRFSVEQEACITATLLNPPPRPFLDWEWPKTASYPSYDWLVATRTGAGHQRVTLDLETYALPNELVDWDAIDNIVIADERIFQNYAALRTLKSWLLSGGRVWIMLDHVEARNIRPLLLAGQYVNVIDESEVTDAILDSSMAFTEESRNFRFESKQGVKLVKVEQSGGEVTHTVNSWPAAIWMPIGDGELLLTTMGPAAWLQPSKNKAVPEKKANGNDDGEIEEAAEIGGTSRGGSAPEVSRSSYELYQSDYELRPWVGPLGDRFHQARVRTLPRSPGLEYPVAQIGFEVLSRTTVALSLIAFCVLLGGVGYWLHKRKRNEWIGWVAPALSLIVGCALALGAGVLRRDIPEGWHRIQLIHADGKDRAFIYEQSAMYRSQPTNYPLKVQADAVVDPEVDVGMRDFRSTQVNLEDSVVSSEGWPTGIWRLESQIGATENVGAAIGTWNKSGLEIRLPQELSDLESLLISQPRAPKSALSKVAGGAWSITEDSTLPPNEYALASGLVDEQFFRREEVLAGSFEPTGGEARPKSLQVMGWGKISPSQIAWDENGSANSGQGDALWKLPLIRLAPELNTSISIPPALIAWNTVSTAVGVSGAFVRSKGEWTGPFTNPMSTGVKTMLPEEVFQLRSAKIKLASRVRAAGRDVIFYARTKNGIKEIAKYFSPQQVIRIELSDPEFLQALDQHELDVIVEVSELVEKKEKANDSDKDGRFVQAVPWQIEYLWMTVEGIANYQEKP